MTAATREKVLAALEEVCRAEMNGSPHHPLRRCSSDAQAVNWGPHAPEVARACNKHFRLMPTYQQTRRALASLVADGLVLRASPHSRIVRYWPVGLWAAFETEKAIAARGAA
jgi:hypothetical protein